MFEKEAEFHATISLPDGYTKIDFQKKVDFQKGAEFGYEQGIARLRYCCTCKHYMGRCYDGTEPYGICADWEIKEND